MSSKKYSALLSQPSSLQSISIEDGPALAVMRTTPCTEPAALLCSSAQGAPECPGTCPTALRVESSWCLWAADVLQLQVLPKSPFPPDTCCVIGQQRPRSHCRPGPRLARRLCRAFEMLQCTLGIDLLAALMSCSCWL
ncbi:V-set and immunoglobulin domain-containing protein 8 [Platysternon megacephalum]|nr:V-set and immunoglobulin domain-containing protein 8 [Platysternon megacephalum]